jgi:hypothetical protein
MAEKTKKTKKLWNWTWRKEGNNVGFLRLCGKTEITLDPKHGEDHVDLYLTANELRQLARDLTELTDTVERNAQADVPTIMSQLPTSSLTTSKPLPPDRHSGDAARQQVCIGTADGRRDARRPAGSARRGVLKMDEGAFFSRKFVVVCPVWLVVDMKR